MRRNEKVAKFMTRAVQTIQVGQKLSDANAAMQRGGFHHLPVVDGERLVGILSTTDLLRVSYAYGVDERQTNAVLDDTMTIAELMNDPITLRDQASLREAVELLAKGQFHSVPVVDDGDHVVGIFTTTDAMRLLVDELG